MNVLTRVNNKSGFTLLEVLIALVILAVGILGMATMQISSIQGNSKGRVISEASNVAADHFERFLSLEYTDPVLTDGVGSNDGIAGLDDLAPADGAEDSDGDGVNDVFWNIADDYPILGNKTIRVIVDPRGNTANISMDIIKMDPI